MDANELKTTSEPTEGTAGQAPKFKSLELTGGGQAAVFYANVGAVLSTPFDIQLMFGEIMEAGPEKVQGRIVARIIMTPEHAALLLVTLRARLQEYVKTFGNLRKPPVATSDLFSDDALQEPFPPTPGE